MSYNNQNIYPGVYNFVSPQQQENWQPNFSFLNDGQDLLGINFEDNSQDTNFNSSSNSHDLQSSSQIPTKKTTHSFKKSKNPNNLTKEQDVERKRRQADAASRCRAEKSKYINSTDEHLKKLEAYCRAFIERTKLLNDLRLEQQRKIKELKKENKALKK